MSSEFPMLDYAEQLARQREYDQRQQPQRTPRISGGADQRAEALAAMTDGCLLDAGFSPAGLHPAAADFAGESIARRARRFLEWAGTYHRDLTDGQVVERAFSEGQRAGGTTASLPGFCSSLFTRAVGVAYAKTQNIARRLTRPIPVPNFRRAAFAMPDGPTTLTATPEVGPFNAPPITDRTEYLQPRTYGADWPFSRQALLNGNFTQLVQIAELAAKCAQNLEDDLVVDLLVSNSGVGPTLNQDSLALFHTTHGNIITSGAAPSVATLAVGIAAMRKQQDANATRAQNIQPKYLLVPAALEVVAKVLVASLHTDAADDNLEVIVAPRLDATSATGWYLLADPALADTLGLCYVGDGPAPVPTTFSPSGAGWSSDSLIFQVRHDIGFSALNYSGLFLNDGA